MSLCAHMSRQPLGHPKLSVTMSLGCAVLGEHNFLRTSECVAFLNTSIFFLIVCLAVTVALLELLLDEAH